MENNKFSKYAILPYVLSKLPETDGKNERRIADLMIKRRSFFDSMEETIKRKYGIVIEFNPDYPWICYDKSRDLTIIVNPNYNERENRPNRRGSKPKRGRYEIYYGEIYLGGDPFKWDGAYENYFYAINGTYTVCFPNEEVVKEWLKIFHTTGIYPDLPIFGKCGKRINILSPRFWHQRTENGKKAQESDFLYLYREIISKL